MMAASKRPSASRRAIVHWPAILARPAAHDGSSAKDSRANRSATQGRASMAICASGKRPPEPRAGRAGTSPRRPPNWWTGSEYARQAIPTRGGELGAPRRDSNGGRAAGKDTDEVVTAVPAAVGPGARGRRRSPPPGVEVFLGPVRERPPVADRAAGKADTVPPVVGLRQLAATVFASHARQPDDVPDGAPHTGAAPKREDTPALGTLTP